MSPEHQDTAVEGPHSPVIGRRSVLAGGSATALGVSSMLLPTAVSATSVGGQGGGSTFGITASSSYTDLSASGAVLLRSFTYGTHNYFVDLDVGRVIVFDALGTLKGTVAIAALAFGFGSPSDARSITSFVVSGDAAYAAILESDSSGDVPTFELKVVRLLLAIADGVVTVEAEVEVSDLNTAWASRMTAEEGQTTTFFADNVSALVAVGSSALHCLVASYVDTYEDEDVETPIESSQRLDRFVISTGGTLSISSPQPLTPTDAEFSHPISFNTVNGVAVPASSPTHALFFEEETGEGILVPFAAATWSARPLDLPATPFVEPFPSSLCDRTVAVDGDALHVAAGVTTATSSVGLVTFDLSSVVADPTLTATSVVPVPSIDGASPTALARAGSTVYVAMATFSPDGGHIAKFQTSPTSSPTWIATATVGIGTNPPWHVPFTIQAVGTEGSSVRSGGEGGAAVGQAADTAPLIVLVGSQTPS